MGQVVLAAKVTHVPSLLLSEREGVLKGRRKLAIESLKEIGKRAQQRRADTFLIFDTHWLSNFGFHINANDRHAGSYTSHEAPHMIQDLVYDYPGNPALADLIAEEAAGDGLEVHAHRVKSLALEYGSIVPMRYMNADGALKVLRSPLRFLPALRKTENSAKLVGARLYARARTSQFWRAARFRTK